MYNTKAALGLLLAFFGYFLSPVDAQVNLKTGYNFSIPAADGLNSIVDGMNETRTYSEFLRKITWLHGFEAGIRFNSDAHALEAGYQGAYQASRASGDVNGVAFTDKLKISIHALTVGYQVVDGLFGGGVDFQYQFFNQKLEDGLNNSVFKNTQKLAAMRFYFMFNFEGGGGVDLALQPYYVLPFKEYDMKPLADHLQLESKDPLSKWTRFGISVLFYNGH